MHIKRFIFGILAALFLCSSIYAANEVILTDTGLHVFDSADLTAIAYEGIGVSTTDGQIIINGAYVLPTTDGAATYQLTTNGSGTVSWAAAGGTFAGGSITSDITFTSNGVDILPNTTTAHTWSIQAYDVDAPAYRDVLRWTNGDTPAVVLGATQDSLAITSTGLNVTTAGAVTGVTDLTVAGAVTGVTDLTASGTLTAGDWSIGTFTTTGVTTLGNNTAAVSIASTGIDISAAGAVSNVTTLGMSGDLTNSAGDLIVANGKGLKGSTTNGETVSVFGYDVGVGYVSALTITNNATPATVLGNTSGTTAISSSDWTISTAGNMAGIGTIAADGVITSTNSTDASDLSTASVVLAGGLAVTKQLYVGDDIDMSVSTTGTYDLTLKTNQADALSIKDSAADIIVFGTLTGAPTVTITPATDVVGAFTAGSVASDAAVSGTTITASTGFALGDGDYIGVTSNEIITFATAGNINVSGANFAVGTTSADDVQPTFKVQGDADSDAGGDTDEAITITLTPNATPTLATWGFTSTQSAGYTFDKSVAFTSGITFPAGASYIPIKVGAKSNSADAALILVGATDDTGGVQIFGDDGGDPVGDITSPLWTRYLLTVGQSSGATQAGAFLQLKTEGTLEFDTGSIVAAKVYNQAGTVTLATDAEYGIINAGMTLAGNMTIPAGTMASGIDINIGGSGTLNTSGSGIGAGLVIRNKGEGAVWNTGILIGDGTTTAIDIGNTETGIDFTGNVTVAAISMNSATFAAGDHEIELREGVGGEKTIIASGTASDDAAIVTAVGSDASIADGSIYIEVGATPTLWMKISDTWTALTWN